MLKEQLTEAMKNAMRAQDKPRLAAIRLIIAAIKQREVDERIELDDSQVLAILDKLAKQRRESITHFEAAGRDDLVATESAELEVIQSFLPQQLTETEIANLINQAMAQTGASAIKDMGQVMAILKPQLQGRADLAQVSAKIKDMLS